MALELNLSIITENLPLLLKGAGITLEITALSVGLGLLIGMFVGVAKLSDNRLIRGLASVYVDCIRGTPLLVQIFLVYFALPQIIGHRIDPFVAAVGACSINSGAYVSEVIRAGIMAVDKGQQEAGRSLGLGYKDTMRFIIIPQALKNILPAMGNEFIQLIKETSILGYVGIMDLTKASSYVSSRTYQMFIPLITAGIMYYLIVKILSIFLEKMERRMRQSD